MALLMPTGRPAQSGFSYLFVLMAIALIGVGLAAAGTLWRSESQRAREAELLFIGDQYRQAIRSYYTLEPGLPRFPASIDELLEDRRRTAIVRHLRRAWRDPMTGDAFVLIQTPDGKGIVGVQSASTAAPFKTAGFALADEAFTEKQSYAEWQFVFTPPVSNPLPATSARPQNPAAPQPPSPQSQPQPQPQSEAVE